MPDKHLNPFCDISPIKPNHLINNWSVIKSQWSLPHYQVAKCYFNLASGSYHYQGFVFSVFFSCYEAVIYQIDLVSYQSIIFTHTSSLALNYHWCPPLHAVCVQHFIYPPRDLLPCEHIFLHHTGASGNRATMWPLYLGKLLNQQSIRFHYLVASVRITNDSNDSVRALTKKQNLRGPTHNRRMSSEVYA